MKRYRFLIGGSQQVTIGAATLERAYNIAKGTYYPMTIYCIGEVR